MYPYIKLAAILLKARKQPKLDVQDASVLKFRAGITDIDIFGELNNARYFNYMEFGRWDYSWRVGFVEVIRQK